MPRSCSDRRPVAEAIGAPLGLEVEADLLPAAKVEAIVTAAYNVVGVLLAALGWLPPIAAAQSLPDVVVMLNSSRLLGR